ncbi:hypothetical protein KBB96_13110 [Luteolibacter ambystomatis]|uniref:Uncharacterized protein n=2 Tax=Luteolibacter ambystomatis TaxID=2824561 RepID=A0A975G656_9BACT|nr:hypothetical protein [Luteolibacter ambystomatis]QUE49809.1 hypothetical protein KBB96_13110 [Luteolibacter ambystomatis]
MLKYVGFSPHLSRFRSVAKRRKNGFSLIITLMMMMLLATLALGLLSLSTITLRQSASGTAMVTARNNARLALMLALGELQKQAGPDQRVTAAADIAAADRGERLPAGATPQNNTSVNGDAKGLSKVQNGTRYWTGVWKNKNVTNPEIEIYTKTPSPELVKWLISGNEMATPTTAINPGSPIAALNASGKVGDPKKAVILVGKNSVGDAGTVYSGANDPNVVHYVSAPLVDVNTGKGSNKVSGRYGWWVGDEGVKARINQPANTGTLTYANLPTVRRGWETTALNQYPVPTGGADSVLGRVVTLSQAELLASQYKDGASGPLGQIFHAATPDSYNVLADTVAGGLRLDLSAYLESLPSSPVPNVPNPPLAGKNILPVSVTSTNMKGPKWDRLKEFKDLYGSLSGGRLVCKPATKPEEYAIAPVVVDFRVLLGARLEASAGSYKTHSCGKIAIALANPYSVPLKWNNGLDIEVKCEMPTTSYRPSCIWGAAGQPAFLPANSSDPAVFNNTIFRIPAGEIPAGEAKAYTLASAASRPVGSTAQTVVNMGPLDSSDATNFEICMMQQFNNASSANVSMDVRETWITSQLCVELRPAGSTDILRRIERFELDNANFSATQRAITPAIAAVMTKPFPLMHYSFQLSQSTNRYDQILPLSPSGQMGLRSSTMRTFADFNMQATRFRKPITSYNPPPYFMESTDSISTLPFSSTGPGGDTGSNFAKNLAVSPIGWGASPFTSKKVVLFSPPQTLASLAQFQHADLTGDDTFASVGHQPGNAVGNSYASPFLKRSLVKENRTDYTVVANGGSTSATTAQGNYYDISHLLNTALWDGYYFSTIPRSGAAMDPLNKGIVKTGGAGDRSPELLDGLKSAGHVLANGGFNINCTEKDAWKALLAGSKYLSHPAGGTSTEALYPRSLEQPTAGASQPTGDGDDSLSGFRRLTDAQIDTIATEIVKQVRLRGPFVSVSQFVNRALVGLGTDGLDPKTIVSRSGALQSALDLGGANIKPDGSASVFKNIVVANDRLNLQVENGAPRADMAGGKSTGMSNTANDWATSSQDLNPGTVASIVSDRSLLTDSGLRAEQGFRSTGIPGWVTQADVLQVIGSSISARSDTFKIRAYGEAVDGESGNTVARAWCEAVVQRMPLYVDASNAASDRGPVLTATNRTFGRQFAIVSFRWLSPDEI